MALSKFAFVLPVLVLSLTVAVAVPAQASDDGDSFASDGSVLATPAEVLEMGGSAQDAATQQDSWDSLSADEATEQLALNEEEHDRYAQAYEHDYQVPVMSSGMVGATKTSCTGSSGAKSYKVRVTGYSTVCVSGSPGTYVLSTQMIDLGGNGDTRLQAAAYKGRVYYLDSGTYKWSTTRNRGDYVWHHFKIDENHRLVILRVQLIA